MHQITRVPDDSFSRRHFLRNASLGFGASLFGLSALSRALSRPDEGFPGASAAPWQAGQPGKKLGIALVGLGKYSEEELAPALEETRFCRLAGIVTGTPEKAEKWKKKYDLPDRNVYNYQTFDRIADNPDIDIVYVVLPNSMHAEYTIRAARAGKHVICEKPMATSAQDCRAMIEACRKADKMLSIGYRLHFEPHNLEMMRLGGQEVLGKVNRIVAEDGHPVKKGEWRIDKALSGGGPLVDVGIYCLQGSIYTKGQVPVSVTARFEPKKDPEKFSEVEESMTFQLQFADGSVADCRTSYADTLNKLRADAANGWFELEPAYEYKGIKGRTSRGKMDIENVNQQARQMDAFAGCVLNGKPTTVPGEMGLRDVQLLEAIYEAARTGNKVSTAHVRQVLDAK